MKKPLLGCVLGVLVVGLAVVLAVVGYGYHLVGRLETPEFKAQLLARARQLVGSEVEVSKLDVSLFSGVTLAGVRVANPRPFQGSFLTADELVLRYRLRPLLSGRVEVQQLTLEKPVIALTSDSRGAFNYEKLGGGTAAPARPASGASGASGAIPLTLVLSSLAVRDARVTMTDPANTTLLAVEDADFSSSFEVTAAGASGHGQASIKTVAMAGLLFLRDAKGTLSLTRDAVKLAPLTARVGGGQATGDFTLDLAKSRYVTNLSVKGAQLKKLAEDAQASAGIEGTLAAKATFEGSGGLETLKGRGRAEIGDCRVSKARVLQMLSALLNIPELANPRFTECVVDFQLAGSIVTTPALRMKGDAIQISGRGRTNIETSAIAYDLNLALANALLDKMPAREMRAAFKDRGDGFGATDFKVWGTTLAPQNDLASRLGKAAATDAAKKGVERLLGGRKLF